MKSDNLAENEFVQINTPNAIVLLSHLRGVGLTVAVYPPAGDHPIANIFVEDK